MVKNKYGYIFVEWCGKMIRLYYDKEFVIDGLKPLILDRFGIYTAPFRTCLDRDLDRKYYNQWLKETHMYSLTDFPDFELHHTYDGRLMLVPYKLHKNKHVGGVGVAKRHSEI